MFSWVNWYVRTGIVLPWDVGDIPDDSVDGRVEAVVVSRRKSEYGKTASIECQSLFVRRGNAQEVRDGELFAFDPEFMIRCGINMGVWGNFYQNFLARSTVW